MTLRCPACAKNNELGVQTACQRCGCDLSGMIAVRQSASRHLEEAGAQFRLRDWSAALRHAETSWKFIHTVKAAQLAALAASGLGDSARVFHWLPHARGQTGEEPFQN